MICSNKTFYFSFLNAMLMQKSKYAKVKIIHAMLKVNMDNYRCYLSARVEFLSPLDMTFSPILLSLRCIYRSQR
jgi:hypothetical protein